MTIRVDVPLQKLRDVPTAHLESLAVFLEDTFQGGADAIRQQLANRAPGAHIRAVELRAEFCNCEALCAVSDSLNRLMEQLNAAASAAGRSTRAGLIASANAIEEMSEKLSEFTAANQPQ